MAIPLNQAGRRVDLLFWTCVATCSATLTLAIQPDSLWIDEGFSAWIADHSSLSSLFQSLRAIGPDLQMPLHYVWLWMWTRFAGNGEYALRAANIPFIILFVVALAWTSREVFGRRFAWLPLAFSPFAWFYINESRAYFMLISFSTAAVGSSLAWSFGPERHRTKSLWFTAAAFLGASLTHVLAFLLLPGLLFLLAKERRRVRMFESYEPLIVFGVPICLVAAFYLLTMAQSTQQYYGSPTLLSFSAALYEHLGLAGFGPPRNELRIAGLRSLRGDYLIYLAIAGSGLSVAYQGVARSTLRRDSRSVLIAWTLCAAFAVLLAFALNSRFLGRHVAALLPLLLFVTLAQLRLRLQVAALLLTWGISDYRLTILPEYGKDDYRQAVQELVRLQREQPGTLAWAADTVTAAYYGLNIYDPARSNGFPIGIDTMMHRANWKPKLSALLVSNWTPEAVAKLIESHRARGRPLYLALSKPDLYDTRLGWHEAILSFQPQMAGEARTFTIVAFR